MEGLKASVNRLKNKGYKPRSAFGFEPIEPFVTPHKDYAHGKIHFNDPDGNSLVFICKMDNPNSLTERMYLSQWEEQNN